MIGVVQAAKYGGIGVGALVVLFGGLYAAGVIGVPDAGLEKNEWGEVEDDRIEVVTTVWVDNPNPVGASVDRVEYDLSMNAVHLASGGSEGVSVPPGRDTITFRTDVDHTQVPDWWAAHVRADEVGNASVTATVHTSVAGRSVARPVTYEDEVETDIEGMLADALSELEGEYTATESQVGGAGGVTVEPTVEVRDTDAEWGDVTENQTELLATFSVHNPNAYPIPTPGFTGEFTMNEIEVLRWDANDVDVVSGPTDAVIAPQTTEEMVVRIELDNRRFADWFATHVDAGERTDAALTTQLAMDVGESEVRIPRDGEAMRCEYDLNTSIFVEQEQGLERRDCSYTAWETTRQDVEDAADDLDLTETEWWEDVDGTNVSDGADDDISGDDDGSVLGVLPTAAVEPIA